ncbi:MAG: type 1 periplasmic binding fold superfamily protein [Flavobacteriales bacterium]|nr:type 1 periplasmic binding fold superfamily protein [Flavobacteriales bacterium]
MKNTKKLLWALPLFAIALLTSCEKNDPVIPNQEEIITTLRYTLTPDGGGSAVIFQFQDVDGDGGNAPVITNGNLASNTTYSGSLLLLNETTNPVDTTSNEVANEAVDHQFFFQPSGINATFAYDDADANGNPIGLASTMATGAASSGTLTITLRHQPDKFATGASSGDITNVGGETDIEVTFDVTIQ